MADDSAKVTPHPSTPFGGLPPDGERLARIETQMEYVATREDVADLKTLVVKISGELQTGLADNRTLIAEVNALIERKQGSTQRWLFSLLGGLALSLISVIVLLVKVFATS